LPWEEIKHNTAWLLKVNGSPFYIKGIVGEHFLDKVKEYGGNSLRTGPDIEQLENAHKSGLYALINLPARAERDGVDYNDTSEIRKQTESIISI
jgi:hypothetical protein